jgi:membrane-associated protease RseP (regulator of RpoE activity)
MTPAAGPLVNGVICLACLPAVLNSGLTREALNPFILVPDVTFQGRILLDLLVLTFAVNWFLLLVNLLPVHPLDGGRLLQVLLSARFGGEMAAQICIRVALVVGSAMFFGALMYESVWVMAVGSFILLQNVLEMQQRHERHAYDDSFMGYDFSQGYTSLEREESPAARKRPGLLERWRAQRRLKRELRLREEEQEAALQMDALLAKVHKEGIEALTDAERRMLDRMSARFRNRERSSD